MPPVKSKIKNKVEAKKTPKMHAKETSGLLKSDFNKKEVRLQQEKGAGPSTSLGVNLELAVFNTEGKEVSKINLNPQIFGLKINPDLVKQVVEAQLSQSRIPYAHTKDRGEVRGGGRKPWRQKGTGRARHGSIRSPIWRGGGVTFGPRKETVFAKKINKKMRRKALLMVLSGKVRDNEMILLDDLKLEQPKTKLMAEIIRQLAEKVKSDIDKGALVALPTRDENIFRATRNIPKFSTIGANSLNVVDLLNYKYLIMPKGAIEVVEKTFLNKK